MAKGGIHTPNHRWVICAALAQIHDLYPDASYINRIDQWLAEGIDIDEEGQFTERSTSIYNAVTDNALVVTSLKLNRPELLEPVRTNLNAMLYLLHSTFEVVTEVSHRQDLNTYGTMERYWFALRYLSIVDQNRQYAAILQTLEPGSISLASLMEYPQLQNDPPPPGPIPERYEIELPRSNAVRIRHNRLSATILMRQNPRWISMHYGDAAIPAVRVASAFFGKGQFSPEQFTKTEHGYAFKQTLSAAYYQPIQDDEWLPVTTERWGPAREKREKSEIRTLTYEGSITPREHGFTLTIKAYGTDSVPLAVELNCREGGTLEGVESAPNVSDAFLLKDGYAEYTRGGNAIRFGPGRCDHAYTQIRGALPKLPGPSVYLTGYTPFEHAITIEGR